RYRVAGKTSGLGVGVGIEDAAREGVVARPEAGAAHLVRVRFAGHRIRQPRYATGVRRRRASREARDGQVEAAPEEMHRAHLAEETAAKVRDDDVGLQQYAPEAPGRIGVVAAVCAVLGEANRVDELHRSVVDRDRDTELAQHRADACVEVGDRLWLEGEA